MNSMNYGAALETYQQLDSIQPNQPETIYNIAICNYQSSDKPKSLLYFLKAHQAGYREKDILYYLGKGYQFNYDLENALLHLRLYKNELDTLKQNEREKYYQTKTLIQQIDQSNEVLRKQLSVSIQGIGEGINSSTPDYVPIIYSNNNTLVFTSRREGSTGETLARDGMFHEDIYLSEKDINNKWTTPKSVLALNGKHHDASVAISPDETQLFIFKSHHNGDIYSAKKNGETDWQKPVPLKAINSRHWEGSVAMSKSQDTLFFSSDRSGGYGGSDLYMAVKNNKGEWFNIKNLGSEINTENDEDAPYIHNDGKTLFFSSKGHNSIGGYDLFSVKLLPDSTWGELKNMGFPINTIDDDIYFQLSADASHGYFTSHRHSNFLNKSIGEKDIFKITRPNSSPVYFILKGLLDHPGQPETIPAVATLKDLDDSLAVEQKVIVELNSGKFLYDLKFENKYKLSIEVGDKIFFSEELFFSYKPELFESLLEITIQDIPSYSVTLKNVLADLPDDNKNVVLNENHQTLLLIRKIPPNDPDLRDLLTSNRIPVSFRKKLLKQLEENNYLDLPIEGSLTKAVIADLPNEPQFPVSPDLIAQEKKEVTRTHVEDILNADTLNTNKKDSAIWNGLSQYEKEVVVRLANKVVGRDSINDFLIDEVYLQNLKQEELNSIIRLIIKKANDVLQKNPNDSCSSNLNKNIEHILNSFRAKQSNNKVSVKQFSKESWGILYTIETSEFKNNASEQLRCKGRVQWRNNGKPAPERALLLTDDKGLIYKSTVTDLNGNVQFNDILKGKRYYILIDDYAISFLGQSRFEFIVNDLAQYPDDYMHFYDSLSREDRRVVDRIIAQQLKDENYKEYPINQYEDVQKFNKLPQTQKDFIERLRNYLNATKINEESAFLSKEDANQYQQLEFDSKDEFNRFVSSRVMVSETDSVFFDKLTSKQKHLIDLLKNVRQARKAIIEDIALLQNDSEFWYVLDEINTSVKDSTGFVSIYAEILNDHAGKVDNLKIALLDELNQINFVTETDSAGSFVLPHVLANKKYKVLISKGENIEQITDYHLLNVKTDKGEKNFYDQLTPTQQRRIDRIIATRISKSALLTDPSLLAKDRERFEHLSTLDKNYIKNLNEHLFADTVTAENRYLKIEDNYRYYESLPTIERDFINRIIVAQNYPISDSLDFRLSSKDRKFYETLNEIQKSRINHIYNQRQYKADVFAENPSLFIQKSWVLLDTLKTKIESSDDTLMIKGRIMDKYSNKPRPLVPIMLTDKFNKIVSVISTDSAGYFNFKNIRAEESINLWAETERSPFNSSILYIDSLQLIRNNTSILQFQPNTNTTSEDSLRLYFDFNSYQLSESAKRTVLDWTQKNLKNSASAIFQIDGFTDPLGSQQYNYALGLNRSRSVQKFLQREGVSNNQLRIASFGETRIKYTSPKQNYLNRNVTIYIIYK